MPLDQSLNVLSLEMLYESDAVDEVVTINVGIIGIMDVYVFSQISEDAPVMY